MKFLVDLTVPCIQAIVPCHLEIFIRDVLYEQLDKINRRKGFSDERIVFVFVVMKSNHIPIVSIDPGKGDHRPAQITADIFDDRIRIAEVWLCVNIKGVFVFAVYFRFCLFERRANALFEFI